MQNDADRLFSCSSGPNARVPRAGWRACWLIWSGRNGSASHQAGRRRCEPRARARFKIDVVPTLVLVRTGGRRATRRSHERARIEAMLEPDLPSWQCLISPDLRPQSRSAVSPVRTSRGPGLNDHRRRRRLNARAPVLQQGRRRCGTHSSSPPTPSRRTTTAATRKRSPTSYKETPSTLSTIATVVQGGLERGRQVARVHADVFGSRGHTLCAVHFGEPRRPEASRTSSVAAAAGPAACPKRGGTVTGTIDEADVIGPARQGIAPPTRSTSPPRDPGRCGVRERPLDQVARPRDPRPAEGARRTAEGTTEEDVETRPARKAAVRGSRFLSH